MDEQRASVGRPAGDHPHLLRNILTSRLFPETPRSEIIHVGPAKLSVQIRSDTSHS